MAFSIRTPAFGDGDTIPARFTKDGDNLSPPLEWSGAPDGTKSFALIVEDPDAPNGMFRHWALYDLPGDRTSLSEGEDVSSFGQGVNDFGNAHYDGPQPPAGHGMHHYHFRLFALDTDRLGATSGDSAAAILDTAKAHALAECELVGLFETRQTADADSGA